MPRFLHVGCGRKRKDRTTPGFADPAWEEVRLDIEPSVEPDIVASITDMTAVAAGSFDALFSSHNVEHLFPHEVPTAMAEFARVLGPEGFAVITCPDLKAIARLVVQDRLTEPAYTSPAGPITPLDMLYGHIASVARGEVYMAHRGGFTATSLGRALQGAGFRSILVHEQPRSFALWALAARAPIADDAMRQLARAHF